MEIRYRIHGICEKCLPFRKLTVGSSRPDRVALA